MIELSLASFASLIQDAKVFSRSFTQLLYSHIMREGNNVAHSLVRHSINIIDCAMWMEDVPPLFYSILQTDIAGSFFFFFFFSFLIKFQSFSSPKKKKKTNKQTNKHTTSFHSIQKCHS